MIDARKLTKLDEQETQQRETETLADLDKMRDRLYAVGRSEAAESEDFYLGNRAAVAADLVRDLVVEVRRLNATLRRVEDVAMNTDDGPSTRNAFRDAFGVDRVWEW